MRGLGTLPKAHLHLHLTGAMRPSTLLDLAGRDGMTVPPPFPAGVRGSWADFQTRYDRARSVIRTSADIVRVVTEAAADDAADGCGWLEIQLDPTCYAPVLGGARAAVEAVLAAAAQACIPTGWWWRRVGGAREITPSSWRGWLGSTPMTASWDSGCPTTSGWDTRRSSNRPSASRPKRGCWQCRTADFSPALIMSVTAWNCSAPAGSVTGPQRLLILVCWSCWCSETWGGGVPDFVSTAGRTRVVRRAGARVARRRGGGGAGDR